MSNDQPLHPVFGRAMRESDTCSRCCRTIPDEHVPLILWNKAGDRMSVYCGDCEWLVLTAVRDQIQTERRDQQP